MKICVLLVPVIYLFEIPTLSKIFLAVNILQLCRSRLHQLNLPGIPLHDHIPALIPGKL